MGRNHFYQDFEYGASYEGYWTYGQMVLQLDNSANILEDLHTGIYFIFLFYHSYGYDIIREDVLNVTEGNSG